MIDDNKKSAMNHMADRYFVYVERAVTYAEAVLNEKKAKPKKKLARSVKIRIATRAIEEYIENNGMSGAQAEYAIAEMERRIEKEEQEKQEQ